MREVAELAGVAMSSVSRVLSGHPDVSPRMRERVLAAVDELGYKPDLLAQSLRRRETLSIGFVVADISNPLFAEIVMGAERELRAAGYSMLLTHSEGDPAQDAAHIRLFDQRRVDGLILSLAREADRETLDALSRVEMPTVLIDREPLEGIDAARVLSDHRTGMTAAVAHLAELGHRRVGLVVGRAVRPATERLKAFREACAARGLEGVVREGTFSVETGARETVALLDAPETPTALIIGGNQMMIGALTVLAERGVELGRDISFIGCDDIPVTSLYRPPIAVVRRDNHELGRVAAELLLARLRGEATGDIVLPTEFVPRPSCAPPARLQETLR
jgi:LacI family transcriptional regulator